MLRRRLAAAALAAAALAAVAVPWANGSGNAQAQEAGGPGCEVQVIAGTERHQDKGTGECGTREYRLELAEESLLKASARGTDIRLTLRDSAGRSAAEQSGTGEARLRHEATASEYTLELETGGEPFALTITVWPVPQPGEMALHAAERKPTAGDEVELSLNLENPAENPRATVRAWVELPSGTSVARTAGSSWLNPGCAAYCEAEFRLGPGQRAETRLWVVAGQPGTAELRAGSLWVGDGGQTGKDGEAQALTLEIQKPADRGPHMSLHASSSRVREGENLSLKLTIANGADKPEMEALAILELPEGTSVTATGFADSCAGQCKALHRVAPGGQRSIVIDVTANEPGEFAVKGELSWSFPGHPDEEPGRVREYIVLNVDHPLPRTRQPEPAKEPVRLPRQRGGTSAWNLVYAGAGLAGLSLGAAALLLAAAIRREQPYVRPAGPGPDPMVRTIAVIPVLAGVALVLLGVLQAQGGAGDAVAQALPGIAIIGGMGAAYRALDLRTAILLATALTCWAAAYIAGQAGGSNAAATVNAALMLAVIAGAAGAARARGLLRTAG